MKSILLLLSCLMLTFAMVSGCSSISATTAKDTQAAPSEEAPRISLEDAKKDFDDNAAIFVDSRDEGSYKESHIKGAINIPFASAEAKYKEIPSDKKIVAYCS